jgi:cysteine synthase A
MDNNPLIRLVSYMKSSGVQTDLLAKIGAWNPGGSIKDRIMVSMLHIAEQTGRIDKFTVFIQPVFKTGVGIAWQLPNRGYKLILTVPDTVSRKQIDLFRILGAIVVLTPGEKGIEGAVEKANELCSTIPGAMIFEDILKINALSHRNSIWEQNDNVDILITYSSTSNTYISELKEKNPSMKVILIRLENSSEPDNPVADEVMTISHDDAQKTAEQLAITEGFSVGISSGATIYAATHISKQAENFSKVILSIFPDTREHYVNTAF